MGKYFGTDGIRGKYGEKITEDLAYLVGISVGSYFGGDCVIGRDSRISGKSLEEALINGLIKGGGNAISVGILPTPAVSYLTRISGAKCGVMISASHNPPEYNGIKILAYEGKKLSSDEEEKIEHLIENSPKESYILGKKTIWSLAAEQYIQSLAKVSARLSGIKVWLDSGNGAAGEIPKEVFSRLGAKVIALNNNLDGSKINVDCGSLHIDKLKDYINGQKEEIKEKEFGLNYLKSELSFFDKDFLNGSIKKKIDYCELGFAFDGDADRMTMVYNGEILCGDSVLYSLSRGRRLKDNVVVGTVMSNIALERRLEGEGKKLIRTKVGDKYILDLMMKYNYSLGGEQSGHYIFYPESATGDGILAAVKMSQAAISGNIYKLDLVPQKTISLPCREENLLDERIIRLIKEAEKNLGRFIVRMSGTEPKVRIMAEDENEQKINQYLDKFTDLISKLSKENDENVD